MTPFTSLFSTRYLTDNPTGFPGIFFDIFTALLVVVMGVSIYVYVRRRKIAGGVTPKRHLYRNVAQAGMWFSGTGLFLALMRYVQMPYLGIRLLTYIWFLCLVFYIGWLTNYLSEQYPAAMSRFEEGVLDKKYRSASKRRTATATAAAGRSPIQRGKRRR